ncbi:putative Phosphoenolpyruvate synthase [Nitrospira tepida]|uniref:Phosphoenolpyruvate synthase n=1 Tax=Nitrospira tepida TaxID=2973512 RepID=A0AA86T1N5_9BACT|nr:PEP/pyruvate-binding domain-containing protein [Nitrospira tepida]CAI4030334.1 putative Phosphoenolpyruvate synthase [Nitrospira tepida]
MGDRPFVLPLAASLDFPLVGGKAVGLGQLIRHGFPVPPGICLTTAAYDEHCREAGLDAEASWQGASRAKGHERSSLLAECRRIILRNDLPDLVASLLNEELQRVPWGRINWWAVRSSGTAEDRARRSMAGLYETALGFSSANLREAILQQWAGLWSERAVDYLIRSGRMSQVPKMAVLLQPMIAARAAGVLFSRSPVDPRNNLVLINAVPGLGAPLVAGTIAPDEYLVAEQGGQWSVAEHRIQAKTRALRLGEQGVIEESIENSAATTSTLTEQELLELAATGRSVERAMGYPVDLEWTFDSQGLWLLQARPITAMGSDPAPVEKQTEGSSKPTQPVLNNLTSVWSRANFKETLPEVPSLLSASFLEEYMEDNILTHYRALGCVIPPELTPVRVIQGRPFINVTLFQSLMAQLGGDPRDVTEQMGGQGAVSEQLPPRLPLWKVIRAGFMVETAIRRTIRTAPTWFAEIRQLAATRAREARDYSMFPTEALLQRLQSLGDILKNRDLTFAIVAGVGQGLRILGTLLPGAIGHDWRSLLNRALQGQGTIISARQIAEVKRLALIAAREPSARLYFHPERTDWSDFRTRLAGTTFLREFEAFLQEYGHRGIGESDFSTPRHADRPDYLLTVIRNHLHGSVDQEPPDLMARQEQARSEALLEIRRRLGWRWAHRLLATWAYRRLTHCLSLREANRHFVMYFSVMVRDLVLALGDRLVAMEKLERREEVFFLTAREIRQLGTDPLRDWRPLVKLRREERETHLRASVPDLVEPHSKEQTEGEPTGLSPAILRGIPISTGRIRGPARLIRSPEDLQAVERGDILIVPVIDPGLAPLFALAGGLIAEMGGTLSHGAIIAREYGLPTVANVCNALQIIQTGDRLDLDAERGEVRRRG